MTRLDVLSILAAHQCKLRLHYQKNVEQFYHLTTDVKRLSLNCLKFIVLAHTRLVFAPFSYSLTAHAYKCAEQGKITESEIREAAKPLLETRFRLGEFDPEHLNPYNRIGLDVVQSEGHQELAIKAAMMSFVLLKNSDNFLPLKSSFGKVAVGNNILTNI